MSCPDGTRQSPRATMPSDSTKSISSPSFDVPRLVSGPTKEGLLAGRQWTSSLTVPSLSTQRARWEITTRQCLARVIDSQALGAGGTVHAGRDCEREQGEERRRRIAAEAVSTFLARSPQMLRSNRTLHFHFLQWHCIYIAALQSSASLNRSASLNFLGGAHSTLI